MPNPVIAWVKHNIPRKNSSRADTNASNGYVRKVFLNPRDAREDQGKGDSGKTVVLVARVDLGNRASDLEIKFKTRQFYSGRLFCDFCPIERRLLAPLLGVFHPPC